MLDWGISFNQAKFLCGTEKAKRNGLAFFMRGGFAKGQAVKTLYLLVQTLRYQRLNRFTKIVSAMLIRIMDVIGMKTRLRSLDILISPGSLPNQLINQGAK
jgi:hypothetical protein